MKPNCAARWLTRWVLVWAVLVLPVWAQSQTRTPAAPKSKAATAPPVRPAPSRLVSADVTAQLQAAAAAAAAPAAAASAPVEAASAVASEAAAPASDAASK